MLSDEERKAIKEVKHFNQLTRYWQEEEYEEKEIAEYIKTILNLIEKQSKEIEELSDKLTQKICKGVEEEILEEYRQTIISKDKEIEELKEDKYGLEEEVQMQAKNIMLCEEALCEMQDKIKAKIEPVLKQLDTKMKEEYNKYGNSREYQDIVDAYNFLQSLLEKGVING